MSAHLWFAFYEINYFATLLYLTLDSKIKFPWLLSLRSLTMLQAPDKSDHDSMTVYFASDYTSDTVHINFRLGLDSVTKSLAAITALSIPTTIAHDYIKGFNY